MNFGYKFKNWRANKKHFCKSSGKAFQSIYMDNQLKEFKELLLDNALFKV
jgi:hypothetical protein